MYLLGRTGGELYVAELARALADRGHEVTILTTADGPLSDELRGDGIEVTTAVRRTPQPDVIHAQGSLAARAAMARHRGTPAIFVSHDHRTWYDRIAPHPQILHYAGVSMLCVNALLEAGAPPERTSLVPNFVDTERFVPRNPLPEAPGRALVFSNYATPGSYVDAIRAACSARGVALDVAGEGFGSATSTPESLLTDYDVVFAKGRAAIEALAVGCAVILCDFPGLGPLVSSTEYDRLRKMNFGWEALDRRHDPALIEAELERYDPSDAARVRDRIQEEASLEAYVGRMEQMYGEMIIRYQSEAATRPSVRDRLIASAPTALRMWSRVPPVAQRYLRVLLPAARRAFALEAQTHDEPGLPLNDTRN
jgi:hypothetical protein